ncbi:MAG: hypothetical protein IJC77_02440 [Bacteroidaceae bacterium]|nr:hypothetical protein [Bacteroidaceae bacterium]
MKSYARYVRKNDDGELGIYPFEYLEYYEANLHPYHDFPLEDGNRRVYDGITVEEFYSRHGEGFWGLLQPFLRDERLMQLQSELEEEGKEVCMLNMCILAQFLVEKGKSRYMFLLKPNLSDTLSALKDVSRITFTNKDGSTVESSSSKLIEKVMEVLEKEKESDAMYCEVEKVVTWDKVSNNSIMQSCFVYDLTMFLNRYFPVKRKKDALVSTKEVELILYLMKLFELSAVELTNKRYWQLMKTNEEINTQLPGYLKHEETLIPLYFIPYSIWSKGKIDWRGKDLPISNIEVGMVVRL